MELDETDEDLEETNSILGGAQMPIIRFGRQTKAARNYYCNWKLHRGPTYRARGPPVAVCAY